MVDRRARLTDFANCAGCAGKLSSQMVNQILSSLPRRSNDPNLLVGTDTCDDAGVYRINDELALVQTLDFFPPLVDDPFAFGQIAAANALSDVYAMNGRPLTVLNIVGFPDDELPLEVLGEILRGAAERVAAAGATTVGGHSVLCTEVVFGSGVTVLGGPAELPTNTGAKPGDCLIRAKPRGTGVITTAHKKQECPQQVLGRAIASMTRLNSEPQAAIRAVGGTHA